MLAMQAEAAEWQAKALRMEAEALKNAHKNDVLANSIRQAPAKSVAAKPELLVVKEQPTEPEAHFRGTPPPWTAFAFIHDRYTGDGQCSGCSYEGQLMSSAGEEPHCGWCWVDFCTKAGYNMSHIKKLDKLGVPAKEVKELDSAARSSKADPKPADSATGSSKTRPRLAIRLLGIPKRTLTDAGKKMEGDAGGKSKADPEAGAKKTKKADASEEEAGAKKTKKTKREKVKGGKKKKTKKKQTSSSSSSTSSSSLRPRRSSPKWQEIRRLSLHLRPRRSRPHWHKMLSNASIQSATSQRRKILELEGTAVDCAQIFWQTRSPSKAFGIGTRRSTDSRRTGGGGSTITSSSMVVAARNGPWMIIRTWIEVVARSTWFHERLKWWRRWHMNWRCFN